MSPVFKALRRFLTFGVTLAALTLIALGGLGSGRLISPPRRALQDYHREILVEPDRFGLAIQSFTAPSGTPCLLVTPSARPGAALKSRELRRSLVRSAIQPPAWGEIRGTIVLLHGHRGRKEDLLPITERFCAAGFRCLLPDLPGHGDHHSSLATFGKNETALVNGILDDAITRFALPPQPAFLFGISQGGAIALQLASRHPDRWSAVASIAAFASLDRPLLEAAESLHPNLESCARPAAFAVACGAWCRSGLWPSSIRPLDAARRIRQPAFIVHGESDTFIPLAQGLEIFEALPSPRKTFRLVHHAGHGDVLSADAARLYPELCAFFLGSLPTAARSGSAALSRSAGSSAR